MKTDVLNIQLNGQDLIRFDPTKEQKDRIEKINLRVIEIMKPLTIPEKAFALNALLESFEYILLQGDYAELEKKERDPK